MQEENVKKPKPIRSMLSGILFALFVFSSIVMGFLIFSSSSMTKIWVAVIITAILAVSTFVLVIMSRKDRIKKCFVPLLVFTIALTQADLLISCIAMFRQGIEDGRESDQKIAITMATIDKAKSMMPSTDLIIHVPEIGGQSIGCKDNDGAIATKFKSIEYKHLGSSSYNGKLEPNLGRVYFWASSELEVVFNQNFDGLTVCAQYSRGVMTGGPVVGCNSYSMDPSEGAVLKSLIEEKAQQQKSITESEQSESSMRKSLPLLGIIDSLIL